jgi:hypothetical protein
MQRTSGVPLAQRNVHEQTHIVGVDDFQDFGFGWLMLQNTQLTYQRLRELSATLSAANHGNLSPLGACHHHVACESRLMHPSKR